MRTKIMRDASYLLPPPGGEVVRDLLDIYGALLTRHNALVEAVAWSRECEDCDQWAFEEFWVYDDELTKICEAARAEVDRLIANETEPTG